MLGSTFADGISNFVSGNIEYQFGKVDSDRGVGYV
jgi:hypothetical protein